MGARGFAAVALGCLLSGAGACGGDGAADDEGALAGGSGATVVDRTATAYTHQIPTLEPDTLATAHAGNGQFAFTWELPQLGPLFNNNACVNCHTGNGRGLDEVGANVLTGSQGLVRVSLGSGAPDAPGGPVPVPGFGLQLQDHAQLGPQEVNLALTWEEMPGAFGDGAAYSLRAPQLAITTPDGLAFRADALTSYRQPPPVFGLGLLNAVADATILEGADPDDADGDGISGHANLVWDVASGATVVGRFGAKANQSTLGQQIAGAFANDIGVTSTMFPDPTGSTEIGDVSIAAVATFLTTIAVPAPAPATEASRAGRALFADLGCAGCHAPTLATGTASIPALAHQTIHPYTDLLVHDMGPGLADGRPDFLASGTEWRTAPLWGLGLVNVVSPDAGFLHDGRARTAEEAILWHGGEATAAQAAYTALAKSDRDALLAFLASL